MRERVYKTLGTSEIYILILLRFLDKRNQTDVDVASLLKDKLTFALFCIRLIRLGNRNSRNLSILFFSSCCEKYAMVMQASLTTWDLRSFTHDSSGVSSVYNFSNS